jgi:hypothetical protein
MLESQKCRLTPNGYLAVKYSIVLCSYPRFDALILSCQVLKLSEWSVKTSNILSRYFSICIKDMLC